MYNSDTLTECTVKKEPNGTLLGLFYALVVIIPIAAIILIGIENTVQSVIFYGVPIIIIAAIVGYFGYKYLFIVDFDYSLLGSTFSVDEIRGGSFRRTVFSVEMKNVSVFVSEEHRSRIENTDFAKIQKFVSSETSENRYYAVYTDEGDSAQKLIVIEPSEEMLGAISSQFRGRR